MPYGPLRVIVGLLCVFFAHFVGRSAIRVRQGRTRQSTLMSWMLRTLVASVAVFWHTGLDRISVGTIVLAIVAAAAGVYLEWRPRHHDELEKVMFPPD